MPAEVAADEAETRPSSAPAGQAPAEFAWRADSEPGLFDEDEAAAAAAAAEKTETPPIEPPFSEIYSKTGKPEAQSEPGAPWPAETVSLEGLFEEEFLIELEPRNEGAELAPGTIASTNQDLGPPTGSEAVAAAAPEPSSEPPPPASGTSEEGLAIVGQYESEGTSYVMYSDGSIEARTAHAVFHFKSMAELRAFLDF